MKKLQEKPLQENDSVDKLDWIYVVHDQDFMQEYECTWIEGQCQMVWLVIMWILIVTYIIIYK